jgi:hypothetical protein
VACLAIFVVWIWIVATVAAVAVAVAAAVAAVAQPCKFQKRVETAVATQLKVTRTAQLVSPLLLLALLHVTLLVLSPAKVMVANANSLESGAEALTLKAQP